VNDVCVIKLNDGLNGKWMDGKWIEMMWKVDVESGLSGCGKWMWRVDLKSGAVPDLIIVSLRAV